MKKINKKVLILILVAMCLLTETNIFLLATAEDSITWYFGEGYVSNDIVEWLNILNPSNDDIYTTITLYYEDGSMNSFSKNIKAHSKGIVKLNDYADAERPFGTKIESTQPIVAQLAHYETARGHGSIGSTELARTWYFGEGYICDGVDEWLNILNPLDADAHTTVILFYENGSNKSFSINIGAHSKGVVKLNDYADAERPFGTKIESTQPIVAQLAHYETARGHGSIGSTKLARTWYFGEGYVSNDIVEWLNILNPSNDDVYTTITLYYEDGSMNSFSKNIKAHSKGIVKLNDYADAERPFGTKIESTQPIVAQLAHYETARGHGSIGSTELARTWYFGEGYVCGGVDEWLNILNPLGDDAHTTVILFYENGSNKSFSINIGAHSKGVVKLNDYADAERPFGTKIESTQPIVVQLAHYETARGLGSIGSISVVKKPSAPREILATPSDSHVVLNWNAPSDDGGSPITGYKIYRGMASGEEIFVKAVGNVLIYTDSDVTNNQEYYYMVSAVNSVGEGGKSNEVGARPTSIMPTPTPTTPPLTPTPTPTPTTPTPTTPPLTPTPTPTPTTPTPTTPPLTPTPTPTPSRDWTIYITIIVALIGAAAVIIVALINYLTSRKTK